MSLAGTPEKRYGMGCSKRVERNGNLQKAKKSLSIVLVFLQQQC